MAKRRREQGPAPPATAPSARTRNRRSGWWVAAGLLVALLGLSLAFLARLPRTGQAPWARPAPSAEREVAYVDDRSCARCHEAQYREWSGSHHDQAMQPAGEQTILGDFNDARFTAFGVTTRFFRRGSKFFVNTEGADGKPADFEIKYTFGVDPLQQYLVEFPGGRLQSLTIAWDTVKKRWFSLYPDEKIPPGDSLHWTGRYQTWNLMCAECHTTALKRGYDPRTDSYRTTWAALNVGCQACHGPGESHLAWAEARRLARAGGPVRPLPLTAQPARDHPGAGTSVPRPVPGRDAPARTLLP
jgi:hypothetical protein